MARDVVERLRAELQPEPAGGSPMRSLTFTKDEGNALLAVVEAAKELSHFLEHEKETHSPPDEMISADCVACESAADYDREDKLSLALDTALARLYAGSSGDA